MARWFLGKSLPPGPKRSPLAFRAPRLGQPWKPEYVLRLDRSFPLLRLLIGEPSHRRLRAPHDGRWPDRVHGAFASLVDLRRWTMGTRTIEELARSSEAACRGQGDQRLTPQ